MYALLLYLNPDACLYPGPQGRDISLLYFIYIFWEGANLPTDFTSGREIVHLQYRWTRAIGMIIFDGGMRDKFTAEIKLPQAQILQVCLMVGFCGYLPTEVHSPDDDQSTLIETSSCTLQFFFRTNYYSIERLPHHGPYA